MRTHVATAAASVAVTTVLGVTGWILLPAKALSWVIVIGFPPLLWAFLETAARGSTAEAARGIMRVHRLVIASLALLIAVDVGVDLSIHGGLLDADAKLVGGRFSGLLKGVLWVLWGNHLPKLMSPWSLEREPFDWQGVHRFVGRVAVAAGLALLFVWLALPLAHAERAETGIILTLCLLALGRKLISVLHRAGRARPTSAS